MWGFFLADLLFFVIILFLSLSIFLSLYAYLCLNLPRAGNFKVNLNIHKHCERIVLWRFFY